MRTAVAAIAGASLLLIGGIAMTGIYLRTTGLNARGTPGAFETRLGRAARRLAIPGMARERKNPMPESDAAMADGMMHFADHCASCHGNDGSGQTEMGRGLYPKAPDMRLAGDASAFRRRALLHHRQRRSIYRDAGVRHRHSSRCRIHLAAGALRSASSAIDGRRASTHGDHEPEISGGDPAGD